MKKIICLIFALALLLCASGCGGQTAATEEPTSPEEKELSFSLPFLPEIGDFVSDEKAAYFFPEGAQDSFTPRSDYGGLLPYITDLKYYQTPKPSRTEEEDETAALFPGFAYSEYRCHYGLMTREGKIITNGIWTSFQLTKTKDGRGYLRMNNSDVMDFIACDGTWALHFDRIHDFRDLSDFGLPCFIVSWDQTCAVYSTEGAVLLDLSDYLLDYGGGYYAMPEILFADSDYILLLGQSKDDPDCDPDSASSGDTQKVYTALDWNGNFLYAIRFDDAGDKSFSHFYGEVFRLYDYSSGESQLLTRFGQPIHEGSCLLAALDEAEGLILAAGKEESGKIKIEYYDKAGAPVQPENVFWNNESINYLQKSVLESKSGTVFFDLKQNRGCDFFGQKLSFPLPEDEIREITFRDYMGETYYFCVSGENGETLVCGIDGTLLFPIVKPEDRDLYFSGESLCFLSEDGKAHIFDLPDGKERTVSLNETISRMAKETFPSTVGGKYLRIEYYDFRANAQHRILYRISDGLLLHRDILECVVYDDCLLVADRSQCIVYDPQGEILLRLRNNDSI